MIDTDLFISQFHFLRPLWLLGIPLFFIITFLLWLTKSTAKQWQDLIAPELLTHLLDGKSTRINPLSLIALCLAWIIACIALAGPTWEKRPVAVEQNQQALVILLDLSPSMMTEDIKPSRLVRARLKIADLLRLRKDGQTALLVYAGNAHVVTPLTDDGETINNILPALHPNLMPSPGSNTEEAIRRALQLLKDANINQGDLLLVTDGVTEDAQITISDLLKKETDFRLSILGVGGSDPAPIPSNKGNFMRDKQRNIITTQLNPSELKTLAIQNRGRYATLSNTGKDIDYLVNFPLPNKQETQTVDRQFDSWQDRGHWLALLLLPVILYVFRRGVLLSFLFILPLALLSPNKSYALSWQDLWKNNNQQAYEQLQQQQYDQAIQGFDIPDWQASAEYRAGKYAEAAKNFAQSNTADSHYNRGNALAKSGNLPEAIKAYDQALKLNSTHEDAKKNRKIVEDLLKQQQQQQQNNQEKNKDKQDQQQDQQKDSEQQQQDQKDQQQQNQQQKDQEKSEQNQQEQKDQQQNQDSQQSQDPQSQDQESKEQQEQEQKEQEQQQQNSSASTEEQKKEQEVAEEAKEQEEKNEKEQQQLQEQQASVSSQDNLTEEERQAMEQWLRRVPDDPGGLLRNKFKYEYYKRNQDIRNGDWTPPENGAEDRY